MTHKLLKITLDYKNYEPVSVSTFETALSEALSSAGELFESCGSLGYCKHIAITEDPEAVYQTWLSLLGGVIDGLTGQIGALGVYSTYTSFDLFISSPVN